MNKPRSDGQAGTRGARGQRRGKGKGGAHLLRRGLAWAAAGLLTLVLVGFIGGLIGLAIAYPNLPDISELTDYRPKQPLRVYAADGRLLSEFGEERRRVTPIDQIPKVMIDAVLAVEDARFYEHSGVDYIGVARAALANLWHKKSQGASTITMQVARNVYLTSEKTYTRKLYEMLLTFKMEHTLSKNQILEIYMNQIYLGHRAYGFAAAASAYFGKPLQNVSLAEAAMLAGIPKSPSRTNPIANFDRARERQLYILDRMVENGFITARQAEDARNEKLRIRTDRRGSDETHAGYVAEMVRQFVYERYGDATYNLGLNVYTAIDSQQQLAAYEAVQQGIFRYERRQAYRGPEKFIDLPEGEAERNALIEETLADFSTVGDMHAAVVLEASAKKVLARLASGETLELTGQALIGAQSGLSARAAPAVRIRPGAVIRVMKNSEQQWETIQLPEVEAALVALDPNSGLVKALVGGFDFNANKFNHATQAWRQPGSSFKPFIYSAALEKGFSPATVINDTPLYYGPEVTGSQPWEPRNYEGGFEGPMSMQQALARSRNIVSIRILEAITPRYAQDWVTRFGFEADKHPPYLTMALGAGSVTPMQMATAFGVFATGGFRPTPVLITRVTDQDGKVLFQNEPAPQAGANRVISARNAFIMDTMLNEVTRSGTAAKAQATLKRPDLYGKTGTTSNAIDAWFVGFQPSLVAAVWMGYDTPRNLGSRETGGGLSLPIWLDFMKQALKDVPVARLEQPDGVVNSAGNWYYTENAAGGGITNLEGAGLETQAGTDLFGPPDERKRILDLFRD